MKFYLLALLAGLLFVPGCDRNERFNSETTVAGKSVSRPGPAVFPVHVVAGKRHLLDDAGKPFFINGDTAWSLAVQLTREQVDKYLDDRQRKGINTILFSLMEHYFADNPPSNAYGEAPFESAGDFSRPNEAYFAHVDYAIARAAEKGMLVMLAPAYLGYEGGAEGWYTEMSANGPEKLRAYGEYVGNRYKRFPNVLWVQGGDYNVPAKELVRAVASGIRSVDSKPHTYHARRGTAAMQFWGTDESWLTVNNIYTDENTVVVAAFAEYERSSSPFFLIEARYEGEKKGDEQTVRLQAYQAMLSGASGHLMGTNPIWGFGEPRQSGGIGAATALRKSLDSPGARSLLHVANLFESRAWWTLEPDTRNKILTAGIGSGALRAVAARAEDGSYAIVYMPTVRAIQIDFRQLVGPNVKAWWYDPSNGSSTLVPGSPFRADGLQTFQPTKKNASNFGDWVLVVESTP